MIDPSLFLLNLTLFVLAIFLGVELINKVPATLHTPLMSGANAVSGISVIGALFGTQIVMQDGGR
ncbi:MAG: proton-translocating transhydrogenase family protein, partial [Planctomycetota bacterium]